MARAKRRPGGTLRDGERRQLARASRAAARPPREGDGCRVLCDGGSRGNPGPAAIAAVLVGAVSGERALRIGHATAAEAEYRALRLGLELAAAHGLQAIEVCSDSKLAIAGVEGAGPSDPVLAGLAAEVRAAAGGFEEITWSWHPAAENAAADALVRELLW